MILAFILLLSFLLNITDGLQQPPKVMVVLLVRNKAHLLENTLRLLEAQDYPKDRIGLYIRSDHNEDNSEEILNDWLEAQNEYHFIDVKMGANAGELFDDQRSPLEWSPSRFQHMIELKEEALNKGREVWADWIWYLDVDAFMTNPQTLRLMVKDSSKTVIAPMLTSVGLYSNFWAGMSDTYYYQRTEDYKPILERKTQDCHSVPMVHSSFFVNLNSKESSFLTFDPKLIEDYDGPIDDIITFALSATFNDIDLFICNDNVYGYIMLPLDENQDLNQDLDNLSNLKIEMFAYGQDLPIEDPVNTDLQTLGSDKVYLVNLDRRPDRLKNMKSIFNELKIDYTKIPAVDGKVDITQEYIEKYGIKMMEDFSEPYHKRPLTLGEILIPEDVKKQCQGY